MITTKLNIFCFGQKRFIQMRYIRRFINIKLYMKNKKSLIIMMIYRLNVRRTCITVTCIVRIVEINKITHV